MHHRLHKFTCILQKSSRTLQTHEHFTKIKVFAKVYKKIKELVQYLYRLTNVAQVLQHITQVATHANPGVPCRWIPGQKFKENPKTSSLAGRVGIGARHTLVNIPWTIAYLLWVTVEGKAIKVCGPASRAKEMLQFITSRPSCALEAPCAGGAVVISTRGASARIDHDGSYMPWLKHARLQIASHRFRGP